MARIAIAHSAQNAPACPFTGDGKRCHKKGGVCSLRLFDSSKQIADGVWSGTVVTGQDGDLRIVCSTRFRQGGTIYRHVGLKILGTETPSVVSEVRFLQRERNVAPQNIEVAEAELGAGEDGGGASAREDVGNVNALAVATGNRSRCQLV